MIPNGLNPHGLENKTLTFSVLENGNPVYSCQSQNRLYCWASFPQAFVQWLQSNYEIPADAINLSIEQAQDEASWNTLTKYKSKELPGNHFMVHGNQTFYYQAWVQSGIPDAAMIYVLDTSGSMDTNDYTQVKCGITGELYDYNRYDYSRKDSCIYVYSAAMLTSMSVETSVLGQIKFGEATSKEIYQEIDSFINNVKKQSGSSESMITNMYYAIANFLKRIFGSSGEHVTIGRTNRLSSASFIMFTDEDIFSNDSLNDLSKLTKVGDPYYHQWFATWQTNATHKFPTVLPNSDDESNCTTFCLDVSMALRQMSYYYGVNFTWGIYGGLCTSSNKKYIAINKSAVFLNKCEVEPSGDYPVSYVDDESWVIPDTFPIQWAHEPMCRVYLSIPQEFIDTTQSGKALKDSITMREQDQYNWDYTLAKFHLEKDSSNEYCAFRYQPKTGYSDIAVTLPKVENMNLIASDPTTGGLYSYYWETYGNQSPKRVACGGDYQVSYDDYDETAASNRPTIRFRLMRDDL